MLMCARVCTVFEWKQEVIVSDTFCVAFLEHVICRIECVFGRGDTEMFRSNRYVSNGCNLNVAHRITSHIDAL